MNQRQTLIAGALLGLLGVALGAFGAHALKSLLLQNGRVDTYELAVRYHFYHALALLAIGLLMEKFNTVLIRWASLCIVVGTILFSGSLYLFALSNATAFAVVTPFGGMFLIGGWALMLIALVKK